MFSKDFLVPLAAGAALFATAAGATVPPTAHGGPTSARAATDQLLVADGGAPTDPKCPRSYYLKDGECRPLGPGEAPG